jgi:hypothetical protein
MGQTSLRAPLVRLRQDHDATVVCLQSQPTVEWPLWRLNRVRPSVVHGLYTLTVALACGAF